MKHANLLSNFFFRLLLFGCLFPTAFVFSMNSYSEDRRRIELKKMGMDDDRINIMIRIESGFNFQDDEKEAQSIKNAHHRYPIYKKLGFSNREIINLEALRKRVEFNLFIASVRHK